MNLSLKDKSITAHQLISQAPEEINKSKMASRT